MTDILLAVLAFLLMLVGLAGIFVPFLPGIELIWIAALGYGILHGFESGGTWETIIVTVLFLIGFSSDFWITGLGMKATGTSLVSVLLSALLLLVGSIAFSPWIGILLWAGAILVIEYVRQRSLKKAIVSTGSMAVSCTLTYGVKFVLGVGMIIVWGIWAVRG